MKHGAMAGRSRRVWRAGLTAVVSLSLVASATSSVATGVDDAVAPDAATAVSVAAELDAPAGQSAAEATEAPVDALSTDEAIAMATLEEPDLPAADEAAPAARAASADLGAAAPAAAPAATGAWNYSINAVSPRSGSTVVDGQSIAYDLRAAVGASRTVDDIEVYLTFSDNVGGAILEHLSVGGQRVTLDGNTATWRVGRLTGGWLWGASATTRVTAVVGAEASGGTLTATISGNARGTSSGTTEVAHRVSPRRSTITVDTAEIRTGLGSSAARSQFGQGGRFALFASEQATEPVADDWATCTVAADGTCVFTDVRAGQYWIGQAEPAAGTPAATSLARIDQLTTGSNQFTTRAYRIQTNVSGQHIAVPSSDTGAAETARSGHWVSQLKNPALSPKCDAGLDIALLMDLSGSVQPYRDTMRDAANGFVDALRGTGSGVALFSFGNASPKAGTSNYPEPLDVDAGASTLKDRITAYRNQTALGQGTNWDAGLYGVASAQPSYDLVVVLTDGNPTYSGTGSGSSNGNGSVTTLRELERAILSANAIKAEGTRVVTVGIGSDLSHHNLAAVSGPLDHRAGRGLNQTDYLTSSWADLQGLLADFAQGIGCTASITVEKEEQLADGTRRPGPGWQFTAGLSGGGTLDSPPVLTTGPDGSARFTVTFGDPADVATVVIAETAKPGWEPLTARCSVVGGPADTVEIRDGQFELAGIGIGDAIECTVVNRELPASISIEKRAWDVASWLPGTLPDAAEILPLAPDALPKVPDGTRVTWSYTVTNTGSAALTGVHVADDQGVLVRCPSTTLDVGESMVCTGSGLVSPSP